jgi:RecG-like helicase
MLLALDNGFQACLMAPTEILANQHFIGLSELAQTLNIISESNGFYKNSTTQNYP